ncbi:hypothetical protein BJX99DRAFT_254113 [Aspergillus californicus]
MSSAIKNVPKCPRCQLEIDPACIKANHVRCCTECGTSFSDAVSEKCTQCTGTTGIVRPDPWNHQRSMAWLEQKLETPYERYTNPSAEYRSWNKRPFELEYPYLPGTKPAETTLKPDGGKDLLKLPRHPISGEDRMAGAVEAMAIQAVKNLKEESDAFRAIESLKAYAAEPSRTPDEQMVAGQEPPPYTSRPMKISEERNPQQPPKYGAPMKRFYAK